MDLSTFLVIITLVVFLFAALYLMILIHELGHLIFGLLTGYSFSSFSIFGKTLLRQEGRWRVKKFSLPGAAGQCLMKPPAYREDYPFLLYNYGGVLANGIIALLLIHPVFLSHLYLYLRIFLGLLCVLNAVGAWLNGFPKVRRGLPNDGMNARDAGQSTAARQGLYHQIDYAYELTNHKNVIDVSYKVVALNLTSDTDLSSYLAGNMRMNEAGWLIEAGRQSEGIVMMEELEPYLSKYPGYYRHSFINELTYTYILYDVDSSILDFFLEESHQTFSRKMLLPNFDLANAAYEFSQSKMKQAEAALERASLFAKSIPQQAVQNQALAQIQRLREKYQRSDEDE